MITQLYGTNKVTRSDVFNVQIPPATRSHIPIPHSHLLDLLDSEINKFGLDVVDEQHILDFNGQRYFGLFALKSTDGLQHTMVGIRNAHDKSITAGIVTGQRVFVCSNLCFDGEIRLGRKHTTNIERDLPFLIKDAISNAIDVTDRQKERLDKYRSTKLIDPQVDLLTVQMYRDGAIPSSAIGKIIKEWDEPSHDEFRADGHSVWRLLNAVTEVIAPKSINMLHSSVGKTQKVVNILDNAVLQLAM
jgi:hypothetical protein